MKLVNSNLKYSRITLEPYDQDERKLFCDFRSDEINQVFLCWIIFVIFYWLGVLIQFILNPRKIELLELIYPTCYLILTSIVFLIRSKFQKYTIYLILTLNVCM